jgi:peptidoglycan/LPS O-acetylase OafA/YrhL
MMVSTRRLDIEGLRGLAVLFVVLYHAFPRAVPGGYIGVSIFFTISGFVVTASSIDDGIEASLFYSRRLSRIWPAAGLTLVICSVVVTVIRERAVSSVNSAIASSLGVGNVYFWLTEDKSYFGLGVERPLLHFWSLAIEEQYYFVLPLLLRACHRDVVFLTLICLSWGAAVLYQSHAMTYYLLPFRLGELLAGSLLHLHMIKSRTALTFDGVVSFVSIDGVVSFVSIVFLCACSLYWLDANTLYPSMVVVGPTIATCLVMRVDSSNVVNRIILSNPLFLFLGRISFGLYLAHFPILSLLRTHGHGDNVYVLMVALFVSVCYGWVSFVFVEDPCRKRCVKYSLPRLVAFRALLVLALYFVAVVAHLQNPDIPHLPGTVSSSKGLPINGNMQINAMPSNGNSHAQVCKNLVANDILYDLSGPPSSIGDSVAGRARLFEWSEAGGTRYNYFNGELTSLFNRTGGIGCVDTPPSFALIGDSYAEHYFSLFDEMACAKRFRFEVYALSACVMLLDKVKKQLVIVDFE